MKTPNKEQLLKRLDEINAQLRRTEKDLRVELERDPEDQVVQIEQDEVSITMERNLRTELADIEEKLANLEDEQ